MLDFAFGQFGYGLSAGMRSEQDRITQNRTTFANNMANFLANNPYITAEAAQAFVNSAAGTDNTLRGVIPNQLVGQINQENARTRRIDTFKAFNEFTRLNPGATAAEFQSAMSALGAQGIYGQDALKAIQSRADQYRKDVDTKRQFEQAQNIGNLRTQLMTDAKSIFVRNGFDVEKTKKELQSIYGGTMPVPIDTIVNPGMATMLQSDLVREYLPKALDIMNKNPNAQPEMLYGIFPELQNSPVVKSIYDAAQTERKKAIEDKFYGNKEKVVTAVANSIELGTDPNRALEETIRGLGIQPGDMSALDTSSILTEAKSLADKSKTEKDRALKQKQAQAAATISTNIQAKISKEVDAARFASMSDAQLEQELRRAVQFDSGLTDEEIAQLPPEFYTRLTTKIRQDVDMIALSAQQQRYDASRGLEATASDALRKDSSESAKNATSEEALTFLGLKDAQTGGGIQAAVRDLATRYDMSGGRAGAAIQLAMDIIKNNPEAASDLTRAIEKDVRFQQTFRPISQEAADQAQMARLKDGSDQPRPVGFTPWVKAEAAQIRKESESWLADLDGILSAKETPDKKLQALSTFYSRFQNDLADAANSYALRQQSQHRWTSANDRWNDDVFSEVRIELNALQTRVQVQLQKAQAQLQREVEQQRTTNMEPGRILAPPVSDQRSPAYNTFIAPFAPTPERAGMQDLRREILQAMPAVPNSNAPFIGGLIDKLNPSNFFNSQAEVDLTAQLAAIANNPVALSKIYNNPTLRALIQSDPQRLVEMLNQP